MTDSPETLDCAVCLQSCNHPTKLPCGHIFCFLCVKGVTFQNKLCPLCRQQIPRDYLEHPILIDSENTLEQDIIAYQWYYEGRNGWWKYDERSNRDLEASYAANEPACLLLIAGAIYKVDFQNMLQTRRNDPRRRRCVRRDTPALPSKGIAGIKLSASESVEKEPDSEDSIGIGMRGDSESVEENLPNRNVVELAQGSEHVPDEDRGSIAEPEPIGINILEPVNARYVPEQETISISEPVPTSENVVEPSNSENVAPNNSNEILLPSTASILRAMRSLSINDSLDPLSQEASSSDQV